MKDEEDKRYTDSNKGGLTPNGDLDRINNFNENFFENFDENSDMEDADEDLLALLDMISAQDDHLPYEEDLLSVHPTQVDEEAYLPKENITENIMSLDENDSSITEDNLLETNDFDFDESILDFNNSNESTRKDDVKKTEENINDVGGIFSNVLSAVDLLDDKTEAEFAKLTQNLDNNNTKKIDEAQEKLSFFQKLFRKKKGKNKAEKDSSEKENKAKAQKETKVKKEAKEKKAANSKKIDKVAKVDSKQQTTPSESTNEQLAPKTDGKKVKVKKAKKEKKKPDEKKNIKKKAEPKPKPNKKAKKIVEEVAEDVEVYKVSKLAIVFVATFIILVSGFVILGTNSYSYTLNLKNAKTNFDRERYTEAYYEIYGLDIRKQDQKTYDKIMTAMYVNKEINSYNNYIAIEKYPEALDSLLKGLERYDKYLAQAEELGIKEDLDFIKAQILDILDKTFHLNEKQAITLNAIEDQTKYSIDVISIALENIEKVASE